MKPYMEKEGNDQKENEMGIKLKKKRKKETHNQILNSFLKNRT